MDPASIHNSKSQTGYKVISENPTTNKGFMNNPAKVAKIPLIQENLRIALPGYCFPISLAQQVLYLPISCLSYQKFQF